jgi:DNA-binding NarL/FixJ family response regulator
MSIPIRVMCVDHHPLFQQGIETMMSRQPDMELVALAATAQQAITEFRRRRPDVTLMDFRLSDMSGTRALAAIRAEFPDARLIMFTSLERDFEIQHALSAGCYGYLLKSTPFQELADVIRKVHAGQKHVSAALAQHLILHFGSPLLTSREIEVLGRIAEGDRNREIGEHLGISEETVKVHVKSIMEKLGARHRTHAVAIGIRCGVIHV